jgi:hypothetical protein
MSKNSKNIPATINNEATSGIGALPSEAKPKQVKQQEFGQLAPSDQPDDLGSTSVASKSRSTRRRARRIHRYPARLDDGAARHPKWKRPNALKHGFYSGAPLIPGEDPLEFNKLHAELIEEWKPLGPTLQFALRRLADSMWRMRRLNKFTQTQLSLTTFDPRSPSFDEAWGLIMFSERLRAEPETCFDKASKYLRADKIDHLKQKFPRSNYQSTSEWAEAVTNEILLLSYPAIDPGKDLEAPPGMDKDVVREAAREWKTEQKVAGCMLYASEILEYDFKETERVEARTARQIRHCAELKALEELRSKT